MNKILYLTKVQLLSLFQINIARKTKDPKEKRKIYIALALVVFVFGYMGVLLYVLANAVAVALVPLGLFTAMPLLFYTSFFLLGIFSSTVRSSSLYVAKDWEQNLSWPVSRGQILLSKLILIYCSEIFFSLTIFLPIAIVYGRVMPVSFLFPLQMIFAILIAPILPLALGALVGVVVQYVFVRLPFRNIITVVASLLLVGGIMAFSFQMQTFDDPQNVEHLLQEVIPGLNDKIRSFFPIATLFTAGFFEGKGISLLLFLTITAVVALLFYGFLLKTHEHILQAMQTRKTKKEYQVKGRESSPFFALLYREFRQFFSSPVVVTNSFSGGIVAVVFAVMFLNQQSALPEDIVTSLSSSLPFFAAILIGMFVNMTNIAAFSISVEGKSFPLLKSFPIAPREIFRSKIAKQVLLYVPLSLVAFLIVGFPLGFSFVSGVFALLFFIAYTVFSANLGLILNLHYPNFDWKNGADVVKRGAPIMGSTFTSLGLGVILIPAYMLLPIESAILRFLPILLFVSALAIGTELWLQKRGEKKFLSL